MRLEYEAPEETVIRDLDIKIDEAKRKGEPIAPLVEKRNESYRQWIGRVEKDIAEVGNDRDEKGRLERQLQRATAEYSSSVNAG